MNTAGLGVWVRKLWVKEIRPILVIALIVFSVRSSLADWNDVPSGSMKPTILVGDRVFVNKLAYDLKVPFTTWHIATWDNPGRGDIAVFYSPHDGKRLVKRVAGLPGDTIELRNNRLILNGQEVRYEPLDPQALRDISADELAASRYAREQLPGQAHAVAAIPARSAARNFGPFTVPEGHYFMMGDNRDDSFDSRYFGAVPRDRFLGRANAVALSLDRENYWLPRWHRFCTSLRN